MKLAVVTSFRSEVKSFMRRCEKLCVAGVAWLYNLDFGRNGCGLISDSNKDSNERCTREPCTCRKVYCVPMWKLQVSRLASKKYYQFESAQIMRPYVRLRSTSKNQQELTNQRGIAATLSIGR